MSSEKKEVDNKLEKNKIEIAERLLNEGVGIDIISKTLEISRVKLEQIKDKELL